MQLFSWTSLYILSAVLCATCLVERLGDLERNDALNILEGRQKDSKSAPAAVTKKDKSKPTKAPNDRPKGSQKTPTAPKTSAEARTTPTAKAKDTNAKPSSPSPSRSNPTEKASSDLDPSTSLTSSSSSPTSSSTSADEPEPQSGKQVSAGGIAAGVVLGLAVLIGTLYITIAKWRERRRHRAHSGDQEAKPGFASATADNSDSHSQDSLSRQIGPSAGPNTLTSQSLPPSSRIGPLIHGRPGSRIPQDVLLPVIPEQGESVTQLLPGQSPFSSPLGSHQSTSERPFSYDEMFPAELEASRSPTEQATPEVTVSGPLDAQWRQPAHQQSPAVELPGSNPAWV